MRDTTDPEPSLEALLSPLSIVTGAPGAGKSSVVQVLLDRQTGFLVFDADRLLDAASSLSGQQVAETSRLWPPYRNLWLTFLRMTARNRRPAVLFIPMEPGELPVSWQGAMRWCLLDCDDATRAVRLRARGWQAEAVAEAIDDARLLRHHVEFVIDTSRNSPDETAEAVATWLATLS